METRKQQIIDRILTFALFLSLVLLIFVLVFMPIFFYESQVENPNAVRLCENKCELREFEYYGLTPRECECLDKFGEIVTIRR